jgi:hypothetical protein
MRTIFSPEEILEYLRAKSRQIEADNLLLCLEKPDPEIYIDNIEAIGRIHKIGQLQGNIQGRLDLMNDLVDFFQIQER